MGRAYEVRKASIAKTGAAKAKLYTMYAKEIYNAAKKGGNDPQSNHHLKQLIERAKKEQVPADIIKRAIDKVDSGIDETYINLRYDGFGPPPSTIIVECLTDNVNRTVSNIRSAFSKVKAKLGVLGSVSHMYDNVCIVSFKGLNEEETLNALINADVDVNDFEVENDTIFLYGKPHDIYKIKNAITDYKNDITFDLDKVTMIPYERIKLEESDLHSFEKLIQLLEDIDDVGKIYHNVDL